MNRGDSVEPSTSKGVTRMDTQTPLTEEEYKMLQADLQNGGGPTAR